MANFIRVAPGIARSNNCRGLLILAKRGQAPCGPALYHRARTSEPWRYQRSPAVARAMPGGTRMKLPFNKMAGRGFDPGDRLEVCPLEVVQNPMPTPTPTPKV